MFLEGCHSKLGCSIILSGPDKSELKQVKEVLKKCLRLARTVVLEKEYMMFIRPDRMSKHNKNEAVIDEITDLSAAYD
jgi:hypothetical protein